MDSKLLLCLVAFVLTFLVTFSSCTATRPTFCETEHKALVTHTLAKIVNTPNTLEGAFDGSAETWKSLQWVINATAYQGWDSIFLDSSTLKCQKIAESIFSVTFKLLFPPSRFVGMITVKVPNEKKEYTEEIVLTSEDNNSFSVHFTYNNNYGSAMFKSVSHDKTSTFLPRIRGRCRLHGQNCFALHVDIQDLIGTFEKNVYTRMTSALNDGFERHLPF